MSQCSKDEWRDKMNEEMKREMLFHEDGELEILSAKDDNEQQIRDIHSFIDREFDIIIVAPNEAEAITPVVKLAYEKGIPVIIFDRRINGDSYTSYIDLDNKSIGRSASEYVSSLLGSQGGKVIEIMGLPGSSPAQERHSGFIEGLNKYPSINLVGSWAGNWEREDAYVLMDSLLDLYPDTHIVYAHNDFMALGIDSILRQRGRRDIKILGTDASPGQGLRAIMDGKIDATFIYPTEGNRIIKTAYAILEGKDFDTVVNIPALASVDRSNAEILLRQYDLLKQETEKVLVMDSIKEGIANRHKEQTRFLRAVVSLAIVLGVVLIITLIIYFRNRKLQKELKVQNKFLEDLLLEKSTLHQTKSEMDEKIDEKNSDNDNKNKEISQHEENSGGLLNDFYQQFLEMIRTQYPNPDLNTEKMAQQMSLGSAQFTRKIKSVTHNTPVEILRNYRLEKARKMLFTTSKTINEITYAVGFTSPAYLTKCFREHFGVTPSDLRSTIK